MWRLGSRHAGKTRLDRKSNLVILLVADYIPFVSYDNGHDKACFWGIFCILKRFYEDIFSLITIKSNPAQKTHRKSAFEEHIWVHVPIYIFVCTLCFFQNILINYLLLKYCLILYATAG